MADYQHISLSIKSDPLKEPSANNWSNRNSKNSQVWDYKDPFDNKLYAITQNVIQGWKCSKCGGAFIDETQVKKILSKKYLPKAIEGLSKLNNFFEIKIFIYTGSIAATREKMIKDLSKSDISIRSGNEWLWSCPKCNCKDISIYRWTYNIKENKLVDSSDNLRILRHALKSRIRSLGKLLLIFLFS